ncbi:MAG: serine hydrolase [bacterium]|nr:serine hydrolase [bacterium]
MIKRALVGVAVVILFQSCYVGRFFIYNFADVRDYKKFPKRELKKSPVPYYFTEATHSKAIKLPKTITQRKKTYDFESGLKKTGTLSFLVIRNDSILYEWYREGNDQSSLVTTFSMSKSYVSALTGIAIGEGYIKSSKDPICKYLTFLDTNTFGKITIQHLLDMQSGIAFNENYFNPFGDIAKYYYGTKLKKYLHHLKIESEPGSVFRYISLNSQLLGLVLESATGKQLTDYLQEKLWTPLGMEYDASWSIDSKKHHTEKAFCCLNGRAKDFAKLGRLYLNNGNWNGKQLIPAAYVDESVNFKNVKNNLTYSNNWWHTRWAFPLSDSSKIKAVHYTTSPKDANSTPFIYAASGDFFAQGLLGQYLYMYPQKNMIIVRFSKKEGDIAWTKLFRDICLKN